MEADWRKLRAFDGSQHRAFEELCCQLAANEPPVANARFTRKGTPDAGIECFWTSAQGEIYAWQAKWFPDRLGASQWSQLDKSVTQAINGHAGLARYVVCLPVNLPGGQQKGRKSALEKWSEHETKWSEQAQAKSMNVEFERWDSTKIFERLTRDENRGRRFFWFNEEVLHPEWFRQQVERSIANVGPRYSPELNIDVPVARVIDGFLRTPAFFEKLNSRHVDIRQAVSRSASARRGIGDLPRSGEFQEKSEGVYGWLSKAHKDVSGVLDLESLCTMISDCEGILEEQEKHLFRLKADREEKEKQARDRDAREGDTPHARSQEERARDDLWQIGAHLGDLARFLSEADGYACDSSTLVLLGDAGTGKTHLLCDVASKRSGEGIPAVLLLGEHFSDGDPWAQSIQQLHLDCTPAEFLGALNAGAQARGERALIIIDALNEARPPDLWKSHLAGMARDIRRYPWVSLVVSVRSTYEELVLPDTSKMDCTAIAFHHGFEDVEYEAVHAYFNWYQITEPSGPILSPDFRNPLFLRCLCDALRREGLKAIPRGFHGITVVFDAYLNSLDKCLLQEGYVEVGRAGLLQKAVARLADMMLDAGDDYLPLDATEAAVNKIAPAGPSSKTLFGFMVKSDLLSRLAFRDPATSEIRELVRFSFQRFLDHMKARSLLDEHLDAEAPLASFAEGSPLGDLVASDTSIWSRQGLLEALSIQVPERTSKELFECLACGDLTSGLVGPFLESLTWRKTEAFSESTLAMLERLAAEDQLLTPCLNTCVSVAVLEDHPLNADFLHSILERHTMADRDEWWSVFLARESGSAGAVDCLVRWAWDHGHEDYVEEGAAHLAATALTWFLTTPHRHLRDRATKALVRVLESRPQVAVRTLERFRAVDEPWLQERLFAAAYGCAMRSNDPDAVGALAKTIFDIMFKCGSPLPDIHTRAYAGGVVERAVYLNPGLDIDITRARPPYTSAWSADVPSEQELGSEEDGDTLLGETSDYHDFGKHVIDQGKLWSIRPIGDDAPENWERAESFLAAQPPDHERVFDSYRWACRDLRSRARDPSSHSSAEDDRPEDKDARNLELKTAVENAVPELVAAEHVDLVRNVVLPYLSESGWQGDEEFAWDFLRRWVVRRAMELGWTKKRFAAFDHDVQSHMMRHRVPDYEPEKMCVKYLWSAVRELLARLSDNFRMKKRRVDEERPRYEGLWQLSFLRDIDPSFLLPTTGRRRWQYESAPSWWFRAPYDSWAPEDDEVAWLRRFDDIPDAKGLVAVHGGDMDRDWLVLEGSYEWAQPLPPGGERWNSRNRSLWLHIWSYCVRLEDLEKFYAWALKEYRFGHPPQSSDWTSGYMGEFFWAPIFGRYGDAYSGRLGWTKGMGSFLPTEVLVTTDQYFHERAGSDCSIEDTVNLYTPARELVDGMGLRWSGKEGVFEDKQGLPIAVDPSALEPGPGVLLVDREHLVSFCEKAGYGLVWLAIGQKRVLDTDRDEFKGNLEFSGAYHLQGGLITGDLNARFVTVGPTYEELKAAGSGRRRRRQSIKRTVNARRQRRRGR